jgi:hypothetical protein
MKNPKSSSSSLIVVEKISASQEIAELQLERLKNIARERTLSYEEVKVFDILTKNLLILEKENPSIPAESMRELDTQSDDVESLMQIASFVNEEDTKKVLNFVGADSDVGKKETPDN